jgi:hypothetical protein
MGKLKKSSLVAISIVGMLSGVNSIADDNLLRARAGVSYNSYDTVWSGGPLKTDFYSLNLGASYVTQDRWYVDGSFRGSMNGTWNSVELATPNNGKDEDYKRNDYTLTIGKGLNDNWTVFGGYQYSDSTITLPAAFISAYNTVNEETLKIGGFFVGGAKSFVVGNGSLSVNASVGAMKAELVDSIGIKHTSDTGFGGSVGTSYSYYFTKNLGLMAEAKYQKYSYDYPASSMILTSGDDTMKLIGLNLIVQY